MSPEPPTPLQAAFRLGCIFNRLRFYLQQAWFLDQRALRHADRLARLLAREVRWAVIPESRDSHEQSARAWNDRLQDRLTSSDHELQLSDDLAEHSRPGRPQGEVRRSIWEVHSPLDSLGLGIWLGLTDLQRPAFRLGEYVDCGVCPESFATESTDLLLPGEALPPPDWVAGLRHRQQEVGVPTQESQSAWSSLSREGRLGQARRLRRCIRGGLASTPHIPQSPPIPDRIRVVDCAAQLIELDGRSIRIEHKQAFCILARLIEAGEDVVPSGEFGRLPGCRGVKIDRVLREHLPPQLRGIIKSKPGNGGGRWLCLPPWAG